MQPGDSVLKRPHAGQNDLASFRNLIWVAADDGSVANLLQRLLHAAKVAHAVIDDDDGLHFVTLSLPHHSGHPNEIAAGKHQDTANCRGTEDEPGVKEDEPAS